ncbi:phosphoglycerate kinase [Candidatus Woesearchaeota archaeon]|nr:phosphoglycerate kinase [Candidatus Woesearchaeota archaeon]
MKCFKLNNLPIERKKVFLRVDFNVPIEKGKVLDNTRIKTALPTIRMLLEKSCTIILATHLGRPEGKVVEEWRVAPLVKELQKELPTIKITYVQDCIGTEVRNVVEKSGDSEIVFLENLRFYKEEEENDSAFASMLASLADYYINEAFAVSHRANASVEAITKYLPSLAGLQFEKEVNYLSCALRPQHPAVWILGGAKLDKIDLVKQALDKADYILIGGALAFSFLKSRGYNVGLSKVDAESIRTAAKILNLRKSRKIILPVDFVVAENFTQRTKTRIVEAQNMPTAEMGLDLGPKTIELFKQYLHPAKTIVWNGPLGYFEWAQFAHSTQEIARFIGQVPAVSICGGGETSEAIHKFYLEHNFTHVSTAGGAAIAFLSGRELQGIKALEKSFKRYRKK